jgi:hypothetical protein
MLLTSLNPHIDAVATIDHLVPRSTKGRLAKRFEVAAHPACNNASGHSAGISAEARQRMKKSVASLGLTLNKTVANQIWSQKIRHAFATGVSIESPFRYFHSQYSECVLPSMSTSYSNSPATLFSRDHFWGMACAKSNYGGKTSNAERRTPNAEWLFSEFNVGAWKLSVGRFYFCSC